MTYAYKNSAGALIETDDGALKPSPVKPIQIGDLTESLLASVGVTQPHYVAVKKWLGLAPICNCNKRKVWLNQVAEYWRIHKE